MPIYESPQAKDSSNIFEECGPKVSCRIYQARDEQEARGALVRFPVLPKLLQTDSLPVQGPPVFLTQYQGFLTVFNRQFIVPLWKTHNMRGSYEYYKCQSEVKTTQEWQFRLGLFIEADLLFRGETQP